MHKFSGRIYALLVIHLIWYVMAFGLRQGLIPMPHVVWPLFFDMLIGGDLIFHALASIYRILMAMAMALLIGLPIGLLSGISSKFDYFVTPITYLLYPLPKIAFLPVCMLLFGLEDLSKIILLFSVLVFQLILSTRDAVKQIPLTYIHVAKIMKLSWWDKIRKLYFPSALPHVLNALKISIGISMAVLFLGENFATTYGLGYFIMNYWTMANYPGMFVGIITMAGVAALLMTLIDSVYMQTCKWHKEQ